MKRKETRESGFWHMRDSHVGYIVAFVFEEKTESNRKHQKTNKLKSL